MALIRAGVGVVLRQSLAMATSIIKAVSSSLIVLLYLYLVELNLLPPGYKLPMLVVLGNVLTLII